MYKAERDGQTIWLSVACAFQGPTNRKRKCTRVQVRVTESEETIR